MPVSCKLVDNEYVVTDKDGKVHGKHGQDKSRCESQVKAINASMEMGEVNLLIAPSDCDIIQLGESLLFEKEHAYVGKFQKGDEPEFELTKEALEFIASESNRYIENGNKCNLPVEHTTDPEKNRGENKKWFVKEDSKGRQGLFSLTEFRDAEAAKLARTAQTSIYAPPTYKDGAKNEYTRPIRHVALTDYPIIPGLDRFTPIAASLVPFESKESSMPILKDLAEGVGLQLSEDVFADDAKATKSILEAIKGIKAASENAVLELSEYKKLNPPKVDPIRISDAQVDMLRENRELKLSALVKEGKILPCVKKSLEEVFCAKSNLTLALSEGKEDNFKAVVAALSDNDPIKLSELSGPQTQTDIATLLNKETNPLMKVAASYVKN